jgi:2'-5' RNA ligase
MRLFIAVELSRSARESAQEAVAILDSRLDRSIRLRWVSADQMHLTVRFIGPVPDERIPILLKALEAPLRLEPFDVELNGCGVFPKSGPPRVVWIGLSQGLEQLQAMHEEFNRRLGSLGFAPEDRPFSAHLTLARIKEIAAPASRHLRDSIRDLPPRKARCRIESATVFKSDLSPRGSCYTAIQHVLLTSND